MQLSALERVHAATNHRGGTVIQFISCASKDSVDGDDQITSFDHARQLLSVSCKKKASDPARDPRTSRSKLRGGNRDEPITAGKFDIVQVSPPLRPLADAEV
jgi:hypothetical protein